MLQPKSPATAPMPLPDGVLSVDVSRAGVHVTGPVQPVDQTQRQALCDLIVSRVDPLLRGEFSDHPELHHRYDIVFDEIVQETTHDILTALERAAPMYPDELARFIVSRVEQRLSELLQRPTT